VSLIHFYRRPALSAAQKKELLSIAGRTFSLVVDDMETEFCFNVETFAPLSSGEMETLSWLLSETFEPDHFSETSFLVPPPSPSTPHVLFEVGPRMNFTTAWSTNAVAICKACGLKSIYRIERSRRYLLITGDSRNTNLEAFIENLYDRMTECRYPEPLKTFATGVRPEGVYEIPILEEGRDALKRANAEMGLGLDAWDIDFYHNLFIHDIGRNPTNVECFDLGQSNSEHSRHWFFRGRLIIDGEDLPQTLIDLVRQPLIANRGNSVLAFSDNSSAISGYDITTIMPEEPAGPSRFRRMESLTYHFIFTAETHNFPSGVAPFPGAETGTGGRIRDIQATGRSGLVIAGTAAYCVGNLLIPGYDLPWEEISFRYPENLASPLDIEIEASNGASDYGNKFGEPVIQGFTRSFGMRLPDGDRSEWIKPIMFTGGIGQMDARHVQKGDPVEGMLVVKIGGPAYRIGIGGGAASSMIQGENVAELDFNAVQRGDAEMEQKLNRVLRACVELGEKNPVISIHDQGAGGNCNVVKEIIYPAGARIEVRDIQLGDSTLSVLEIWGAEYQEQNALLIREIDLFQRMCEREKVPFSVIGRITGDGYIVLHDRVDGSMPVNLALEKILGDMPQKVFRLKRIQRKTEPLLLPGDLTVKDALPRVLRLLSVGSKRFLTNKVDRSVTGLIARQQCAGPLQLTVSDVAVIGQSHFSLTGAAISIGEQPIKGLVDPAAMARMCVGESLTNMVWAKISSLEDIKCSGNWMWAAKLDGEGARLYDAAVAMADVMTRLGIAVDGGKDSLSMAAQVPGSSGGRETVKAPGTLVISAYASCPDITRVITPDIKRPGLSRLMYIDLGKGKYRLGGTALAHVYKQLGEETPDLEDTDLLARCFRAVQSLIAKGLVLAGHDRSDGGLITTMLEMCFAGNCGIEVDCVVHGDAFVTGGTGGVPELPFLFSEELGLVLEYLPDDEDTITDILGKESVPYETIGRTQKEKKVKVILRGPESADRTVLDEDMESLRDCWEETGFHLELLQANPKCARDERAVNLRRKGPRYSLTFTPDVTPPSLLQREKKPGVAIVREEGSNSDREMSSAFYQAGFDVWDVTMTDLIEKRIGLSGFRGIVFVGGFSYADVLDSAKGWAGVVRFNGKLWQEFQDFYRREDTFSLGVCNGCQLMALLGWVPWSGIADTVRPRFIHNVSGRFESRFSTVRILPSKAVMLRGMEDSVLGIWVAHGEGRAFFPDAGILNEVEEKGNAPIRYVDDNNEITTAYPFNPNGSSNGIAALSSADGRHLAMMPHPERTFLKWQWGWMPEEWHTGLRASPWLRLFQNAREWCDGG
jgi:phosphoribosylformylglycinamidine synthase